MVFDKLLSYPTSLAGPVYIGAPSPPVESTLGGVPAPFACDLFRFGLSLSSCLVSFHPSWELVLLKPSLLHTLASRRVLVVLVTARTSPSLRVVYDVHDCFVDRHNKKPAPSKGQAWRMNNSPSNSGNISIHRYRLSLIHI